MSLIVNMACGLANRMFQYAYYLYLREQGYDAFTDAYDGGRLAHEDVAWDRIFPNASLRQCGALLPLLYGGGNDVASRFRRRFMPWATKVLQMPTAFSVELPTRRDQYIIGVFQSAAMVEGMAAKVRSAFTFAPLEGAENKALAAEMEQVQSVAIHVRKAKDYQSRIWYQDTCPVEYYQKAVAYMRERLTNPRFYVFTDNVAWVRENLQGFDYTLVEGNPASGWGQHFDMLLMSLCHHNILSNSTYSWWAAWLNAHQDKQVVLPNVWFNPKSCDDYTSQPVACEGWKRM